MNKFPDSEAEIDVIISDLKKLGYIDDEKNAHYYVDLLISRGYGREYIKRYLKKKGFPVPDEIVVESSDSIEKWFLKKTKGKTSLERKDWQRVFLYLKSKGFTSEEIFDFFRKRRVYEGERDSR